MRWLALLLVASGAAAYANSFAVPFVFDDHSSILENPHIRQLWPLPQALGAPVQSALAGRPVVSLSLALNYAIGGLAPSGYHAWNLGVHLLCGLLVFGIIRRTLELFAQRRSAALSGPRPVGLKAPRCTRETTAMGPIAPSNLAFACGLIWLVHPLQTEVIDYVTQRTESMMAFFYLLTLYASIRVMTTGDVGSGRWEAVAIMAGVLGALTKEPIATAPLMVLLYDAVFQSAGLKDALRSRRRLYVGLALTWVVLAVIVAAGPRWRSAGFSSGVSPWVYLLNQPEMIVRYLRLAVWPVGQVLDYGIPRIVPLNEVVPYAAVVLSLLAATVLARRRRPELAFLGTWFFVTLAPSSSIIPIATEVGAERRMYLPLIALVVAMVMGGRWLLELWMGRNPSRLQWVSALCLVTVFGLCALLTIRRNAEYTTEAGIWQTVLDRRPHGRAHYSLALELKQLGRRDEAMHHYRLALSDTPDAHYAIGFELDADGKHAEAIEHYREFVRLMPDAANVPNAYLMLGRALAELGERDAANDAFGQVLRMRPGNIDARIGLAAVLLSQWRYEAAIAAYREIVSLDPASATAYANLGIALVGLDREPEAVPVFERAVELGPGDAGIRSNLGNALAAVGRLDDAVAQYERAIALAPANASIHHALGLVLNAQGKEREAAAALRRAIDLDPQNEEVRADLARVVAESGSPAAGR